MKKKVILAGSECDVEYRVSDGFVEVIRIHGIDFSNSAAIEAMGLDDIARDIIQEEIDNGN